MKMPAGASELQQMMPLPAAHERMPQSAIEQAAIQASREATLPLCWSV
jgi:hypothetical protein